MVQSNKCNLKSNTAVFSRSSTAFIESYIDSVNLNAWKYTAKYKVMAKVVELHKNIRPNTSHQVLCHIQVKEYLMEI